MRVLHIGKYYPPFNGGMENYMGDLLPTLRDRGIDAVALVHAHKKANIDLHYVHHAPCFGQLVYAPVSPQFPVYLERLLGTLKPDLLHIHLPNTSALWALTISKAKRIPWVIHWHADVTAETHTFLSYAYHLYEPLEHKLLEKSQAIIATSPPYLDSSRALSPWRYKCHVIPLSRNSNGFPKLSQVNILKANALWGNKKRKVLAVSRMSYYKGLEYLIQAVKDIESIQLIIVVSGTKTKLEKHVTKLNLDHKVLLADSLPTSELHSLIATCDSVCLPSVNRAEAFGLVLLEAMYYGKPSIVSAIPGSGVCWVVEDGITGKHVPPKSIDKLSQVLNELGNSRSKWLSMGENAKKRYNELFNISESTNKIVSLYNDIL